MTDIKTQQKILVVDDTPSMIDVLRTTLENERYQVFIANSGEKAISRAKLTKPDLVLLDVLMPQMDGFTVCHHFKSDDSIKDIPIIMMTALTATEHKVKAFEVGCVDYITKPIEINEVLGRIRIHLSIQYMRRQLKEKNDLLQIEINERILAEKEIKELNESLEMKVKEKTADLEKTNALLQIEIEERKRIERDLRDSEELHRVTIQNIYDPVFITDEQGRFTYICSNVSTNLGYSVEELKHMENIYQLVSYDLFDLDELDKEGAIFNIESLVKDKAGNERTFLVNVKKVSIKEGTILFTLHDITDRKRVEEELSKSEERFRRLAENARDVIYRMSLPEGKYEYVSPAALSVFGYSPEECYKTPILIKQAIHPDWHKYFEDQWINLLKGEMPPTYEYQFIHKSGEVRWFNQRNILIRDDEGNPIAIEGIVTDISERKHAEIEIKATNKILAEERNMFIDGPVVVFRWKNEEGWPVEYVSPNVENVFGYSVTELTSGKVPYADIIPREDIERIAIEVSKHSESGVENFIQSYRIIRKDGKIIWTDDYTTILRDENERITHYQGYIIDITERKQAEEEVQASETRFRAILENSQVALYKRDYVTNSYDYMSPVIARITGYTSEELKSMPVEEINALIHQDDLKKIQYALSTAIANGGGQVQVEYRFKHKNGEIKWVSDVGKMYLDYDFKPLFCIGSVQDITERKLIEEALNKTYAELELRVIERTYELQKSNEKLELEIKERRLMEEKLQQREEQLNTLINAMPDLVIFKDGQGRYLETNDYNLKFFGLQDVDYRGKTDTELAEFTPFYYEALRSCIESDDITWQAHVMNRQDECIPRPDGSTRVFDVIKVPTFHPGGERKGLIVVGRDVTERKQAEEALREAHASLEKRVEERTYELRRINEQLEKEIIERIRIENHLRIAEGEKSLLLNSTLDLVVYHGLDMKILWANKVASDSIKLSQDELVGKYCWELWHRRNEPCVNCPVILAKETGQPHLAEIESPDGKKWFIRGHPLKDESGNLVGMAEFCLDITERKHAEEALKQSEKKYRLLFENSPLGIFLIDRKGEIINLNSAGPHILGSPSIEATKAINILTFPLLVKSGFPEKVKECFENGEGNVFEFLYTSKWGKTVYLRCHLTPIINENNEVDNVQLLLEDFTEIKKAEEELQKNHDHLEDLVHQRTEELRAAQDELVRNERFAALGQLTAIVSHELRNPLGTIRNSIYEINERLRGKNTGCEKTLNRADRNIVRCDKIIEELLDYTRESEHITEQLLIDEWIIELLNEITIPENIKLERMLNAGVEVNINPEGFRRCLINLIDNAVQAMTAMAKDLTSKGNTSISNKLIIETATEDGNLIIKIKDNGPGIASEELKKIFEPLYSTKGFGVGLGLPIVKKIVEQHNGNIEITSKIGKGTVAVLQLPIKKK
ncbi:MAG: PAS domain S-box protein [bacterium]